MARLLFEMQAVRRRNGQLANGVALVIYSDEAGTVLADISASSVGSAIAGSAIVTADIAGLGPAAFRFYGPPSGQDTLYLRCPADPSLGVQEIEADTDERLDALEAGGGGGHPNLAIHDALGLATDAELGAVNTAIDSRFDTDELLLDAGLAPPTISGLTLWLAADRITGLADGAAVATWADASGNGYDVTQATAGNRPTYKTGILNGRPVVRFVAASSQHLGNAVSVALKPVTILAVMAPTSVAAYQTILGPISGSTLQFRIAAGGQLDLVRATFADIGLSTGTVTAGAAALATATYSSVGAYAFYRNGTADGSGTNNQTIAAQAFCIGANATSGEFLGGDLAELVVYNRVLSTVEREQVEWWLGQKYGLSVAAASSFVPATTLTTTAVRTAKKLAVTDRGLWVSTSGSDSNDGLSGGTAKLTVQAAVTALVAAGGGIANVLGGTHDQTAEIIIPQDAARQIRIVGQAAPNASDSMGTILRWQTTLGSGTFGIKPSTANARNWISLEDLTLSGPGGGSYTLGAHPTTMDGIQVTNRTNLDNVIVRGFRVAAKITGDHNRFRSCHFNGNGYGLYFADMNTYGDLLVDDCHLDTNALASVAVGPSGRLLMTTFLHCHLGFSPYSLHIETGGDANPLGWALHFVNTSFEAAGIGHIVGPTTGVNCQHVLFDACGNFSSSAAYLPAATSAFAPFRVATINGWQFRECYANGDQDWLTAKWIDADVIQSLDWSGVSILSELAAAVAAGVPYVKAKQIIGARWRDNSRSGWIVKAKTAATVRNLLGHTGDVDDQQQPYADAYTASSKATVAGVAMNTAPAHDGTNRQEALFSAYEGHALAVDADADVSGNWLMVSTSNRNQVTSYDGGFASPVVGRHMAGAATGPGATQAHLHLARPSATVRQTVTGSRGGNAALADLLTKLATLGLITDSTS